jgi:DNA transposition AAA+ family ATPase
MARKRINMKKIREIIRFKETTDMSERKIARALKISRPVVAQYETFAQLDKFFIF